MILSQAIRRHREVFHLARRRNKKGGGRQGRNSLIIQERMGSAPSVAMADVADGIFRNSR
jgi:hypothetical protein